MALLLKIIKWFKLKRLNRNRQLNLRLASKLLYPFLILIIGDFILPICKIIHIFNILLKPFSVFWGHIIPSYNPSFSSHLCFKPEGMDKKSSPSLFSRKWMYIQTVSQSKTLLRRNRAIQRKIHTWTQEQALWQVYQVQVHHDPLHHFETIHLHTYEKIIHCRISMTIKNSCMKTGMSRNEEPICLMGKWVCWP